MDQVVRKHLWIVTLLSLALMALFMASGTGALVSLLFVGGDEASNVGSRMLPGSSKSAAPVFSRRSGDDVCRHNIFDFQKRPCGAEESDPGEAEGDEEAEDVPTGVPPMCSGESKLVATMASSDPAWSFAMIAAAGKTMPYRAGDAVDGLGTVRRVGWRLVLVDAVGGPECLLDLYPTGEEEASNRVAKGTPPGPPIAAGRAPGDLSADMQKAVDGGIEVVSANERNVERSLVDRLIENSSELMSQARILPYERDGQVQGFKLYGIRRNSLLGKLGLRNGDIVNNIGGMEMTSPDRALQAYTKLQNASNLTVTVTRQGRRQNLDFNIR